MLMEKLVEYECKKKCEGSRHKLKVVEFNNIIMIACSQCDEIITTFNRLVVKEAKTPLFYT